MANYSTKDLLASVLQHSGERTDGTSPYQPIALGYINNVYKAIISGPSEFAPEIGDAWSWARITQSFVVPGYYETGTLTVTSGSPNATLSVAPTISLQGYDMLIRVSNERTWYRVESHTAGSTAVVLDAGFVGSSGSGLTFRAVPLEHDLGDGVLRLVEPFRIYRDRVLDYGETAADQGRIYGVSPLEFWKRWPMRQLQNGVPSKFTTVRRSESAWVIRFNKYVTEPLKVDWDYIPIPAELSDSSESIPIVPFEWRDILVHGATHYLLVDKSQETKAQRFFGLAQAKIIAMHLAEEKQAKLLGVRFGQLTPRLDDTAIPWYVNNPTT